MKGLYARLSVQTKENENEKQCAVTEGENVQRKMKLVANEGMICASVETEENELVMYTDDKKSKKNESRSEVTKMKKIYRSPGEKEESEAGCK